jgi:hypothetical protein
MKPFLLLSLLSIGVISCNSDPKPEPAKTDSVVANQPLVYPFKPKYSLNWQAGDEKNALIVLNCLKNFNEGNMKAVLTDFADTVEFIKDRYHFRGSRDSLQSIVNASRSEMASVSKVFDTWITTYYPDQKDTWVTLWYTEYLTDKKGKQDSLYYVDDVLIKNGKVVVYDEKQRLFPDPPTVKK